MARTEPDTSATSSSVLQRCWEDFVTRYERQHGSWPSKQMVSTMLLLDDASLMSRWTNADKKPGWRIPVRRIAEAAFVLELTPEQVQDLMLARLVELEQQDQACDAVVVAEWCAEVLGEAEFLSDEERRIVAAFRKVTDVFADQSRCLFQDDHALELWFTDRLTGVDDPVEAPPTAEERAAWAAVARKVSLVARRAPQAQDQRHVGRGVRARAATLEGMRALTQKTRRGSVSRSGDH